MSLFCPSICNLVKFDKMFHNAVYVFILFIYIVLRFGYGCYLWLWFWRYCIWLVPYGLPYYNQLQSGKT